MPTLELDLDYFEHPKTLRLVGLLGKGSEVLPIKLWRYCGKHHAKSGRLAGYSTQEIESLVGWWGKEGSAIAAMVRVGFIDETADGYAVHNWTKRAGHLIAFQIRAQKGAAARWNKIAGEDVIDELSNASSIASGDVKHCPIRTNVRTNVHNPHKPPKGGIPPDIPESLNTPEFREAWDTWNLHRKEIGKPQTGRSIAMQFKRLEKMGPARAVAAIEHSIANSYRGIFEDGKNAAAVDTNSMLKNVLQKQRAAT